MIEADLTRRGFLCATALGVMGLAGCSFTPASSEDESAFKLLGAFVIEPTDETISAGVDFSSIPDTRKLVMCVFDIDNSTDKNWGGSLSCTMSYGSGNDYKSSMYDQDLPKQVKTFMEHSGYTPANGSLTLDAGSDPVRVLACFLINAADLKENGTLKLGIDGCADDRLEVSPEKLETVAIPDAIFEVEKDPDAYQLARSMYSRGNLAWTLLAKSSTASAAGNTQSASVGLASAMVLFSEDAQFGISLMSGPATGEGTNIATDTCPVMNFAKTAEANQEASDDASAIYRHLSAMCDAWDAQDYDALNASQDALEPVLKKYIGQ